jgi:hypothetical protein
MNFKQWLILSEELYTQNNTATVFHRTKSFETVQEMMNDGFRAGGGDYHGPGLYTTYTLEGTTNLGYGDYVVKLKVNNLNNYFVLEPDVAKQIHGNNWKLKDQARILKLTLKLTDEQWQKYQEISEKGKFGSAAASQELKKDRHNLWEHGCKGIIYNGGNDGKCICVYAPYEGLTFLAYANAPTPTTVDFIEKNWVNSAKNLNFRTISNLNFPQNISSKKQYEINPKDDPYYELNPEGIPYKYELTPEGIPSDVINDVISDGKNVKYWKLKFYMKKNKLTGDNVLELIKSVEDKEKMAKILGKENMYQLSSRNVIELIIQSQWSQDPKKQEEMFILLGTDIINKLSDEDVQEIIPYDEYNEEDLIKKYKVVNLIIKYKTKLTGINVFQLIQNSENSEKTAEILGTDNINKLSASNIVELLSHYKCNVEEMAKILGKDNINKINGLNLYNLVYTALSGIYLKGSGIHPESLETLKNSNEILKALGPKNIAKLSDDNVKYFIDNAKNPEEMARILGKENIEKIHK